MWRSAAGTALSSRVAKSIRPAVIVRIAITSPAPIASQAIGRASTTPASVSTSQRLPADQKAIGKCTSIGCSGCPNSRIIGSNELEGGAGEQQESDHRDRGVDQDNRLGTRLRAQVERGEKEPTERGDEQDDQRDRRILARPAEHR